MWIALRDLVPDYLHFQREARERRPAEFRPLWERLYAGRHADVFERYFSVGEPPDFEAALVRLVGTDRGFSECAGRVEELARSYAPQVAQLLEAEVDELRCATMVGLFRADGWVDDLAGTPTAFFALEQFREPPWDEAHVVHETTHLVHAAVQPEPWRDEVIGLRLLLEGLAVSVTHLPLPELPEWTHFNFAPTEIDAWLQACEDSWPQVAARLRELASATDPAELDRYFSPDWLRAAADVPAKVGYFAGARVVGRLGRDLSLAELARLRPSEAIRLAAHAVGS